VIVERYLEEDASIWNAFVSDSRNGTFQFNRGYMDYHRDRFDDHSMLIWNTHGELEGLLPAHANTETISSHLGLSHGGLILGPQTRVPEFTTMFESLLIKLQELGFASFDYKTIPHIYHRQPAEDDRYAVFLLNSTLVRRDVLSVIDRAKPLPFQSRRVRGIKKARSAGLTVREEQDFTSFWSLLADTLASRHGALPVHSREEIQMLHERFPTNIRLHTVRSSENDLLAGVVLYLSERVTHVQYIASSPHGREVGALDLLFDSVIHDPSNDAAYFDFGSSHEEAGQAINQGLIEFKEGFGARSVTFDQYRIDLATIRPGILTGALR